MKSCAFAALAEAQYQAALCDYFYFLRSSSDGFR